MYLEHALKDPSLLRHQAYIGGEWQAADSDATFEVFDPATGESLGTVPKMGRRKRRVPSRQLKPRGPAGA